MMLKSSSSRKFAWPILLALVILFIAQVGIHAENQVWSENFEDTDFDYSIDYRSGTGEVLVNAEGAKDGSYGLVINDNSSSDWIEQYIYNVTTSVADGYSYRLDFKANSSEQSLVQLSHFCNWTDSMWVKYDTENKWLQLKWETANSKNDTAQVTPITVLDEWKHIEFTTNGTTVNVTLYFANGTKETEIIHDVVGDGTPPGYDTAGNDCGWAIYWKQSDLNSDSIYIDNIELVQPWAATPPDTEPPDPDFISPTQPNNTMNDTEWFFVNVSVTENASCYLDVSPTVSVSELGSYNFEIEYATNTSDWSVDNEHATIGNACLNASSDPCPPGESGNYNITLHRAFDWYNLSGITSNVTNATYYWGVDEESTLDYNDLPFNFTLWYNSTFNGNYSTCGLGIEDCWNAINPDIGTGTYIEFEYDPVPTLDETYSADITTIINDELSINGGDGEIVIMVMYENESIPNYELIVQNEWSVGHPISTNISYTSNTYENETMTSVNDTASTYCYLNATFDLTPSNGTEFHYRVWVFDPSGNLNVTDGLRTWTYGVNAEGDTTPPTIAIASPTNTSYSTLPIDVNFTVSEDADWCGFNLDSGTNTTLSNSSMTNWYSQTNSSLINGTLYQLFAYCNDTAGNMGSNTTIWFTYDVQSTPNTAVVYLNTSNDTMFHYGDTINFTITEYNETKPVTIYVKNATEIRVGLMSDQHWRHTYRNRTEAEGVVARIQGNDTGSYPGDPTVYEIADDIINQFNNEFKPDLVIEMGDFGDSQTEPYSGTQCWECTDARLEEARDYYDDNLTGMFYDWVWHTPGNHELNKDPADNESKLMETISSNMAFTSGWFDGTTKNMPMYNYNDSYYNFTFRGVSFIGMNTAKTDSIPYLEWWVNSTLDAMREPAIPFMHIPISYNNGAAYNTVSNQNDFCAKFADTGITPFGLNGHIHSPYMVWDWIQPDTNCGGAGTLQYFHINTPDFCAANISCHCWGNLIIYPRNESWHLTAVDKYNEPCGGMVENNSITNWTGNMVGQLNVSIFEDFTQANTTVITLGSDHNISLTLAPGRYRWNAQTSDGWSVTGDRFITVGVRTTGSSTVQAYLFNSSTNISASEQFDYDLWVTFNDTASNAFGEARMDFIDADIDISGVNGSIDTTNNKAFFHATDTSILKERNLLIPRTTVGSVYICPGATSLSAVNESCPNKVHLSTNGSRVSGMLLTNVTVNGLNYYKVANISGTGGGEGSGTPTGYTCGSCSDCSNYIQNSSAGDNVTLTADLSATTTCIDFGGNDGVDFYCDGYTITSTTGVGDALKVYDLNDSTIQGCSNISYFANAIHSVSSNVSGNLTLYNITIHDTSGTGIVISGYENNLTDITIRDAGGAGLTIAAGNNEFTRVNASYSDSYGLHLFSSSNNTLEDCDFISNADDGIYLQLAHGTIINNTVISGTSGSGKYNLEIAGEYCNFTNNILDGSNAIRVNSGYNNSLFYNNNITGTNSITSASTNSWNTTYAATTNILGLTGYGGNFWSGYGGTDADGNGIGDTSNTLSTGNIDYLPLMSPNYTLTSVVMNITGYTNYSFSAIAGQEELVDITIDYDGNSPDHIYMTLYDDMANTTLMLANTTTNVSVSPSSITTISLNMTIGASCPAGSYSGNITFTSVNDSTQTKNITIGFTISAAAANMDITNTTWSVAFTAGGSASRYFLINNTGDYNGSHCNMSYSGLGSVSWDTSDFTVQASTPVQVKGTWSGSTTGSSSTSLVTVTCTATALGGTDSDQVTGSVSISAASGGGGGGGGYIPPDTCGSFTVYPDTTLSGTNLEGEKIAWWVSIYNGNTSQKYLFEFDGNAESYCEVIDPPSEETPVNGLLQIRVECIAPEEEKTGHLLITTDTGCEYSLAVIIGSGDIITAVTGQLFQAITGVSIADAQPIHWVYIAVIVIIILFGVVWILKD